MLRQLIILAILIFPVIVFGQHIDSTYKNQIKISPFRIVDPVNPGVEISYERLHSKRFSTQLSVAYMTDVFGKFPYTNLRGYRVSLEEKYFIHLSTKARNYLSADIVYNNSNFKDVTTFRDTINNLNISETFSVNRMTASLNLKFGKQILRNRFIIDWCVGVGLKYRDVVHSNRTHPMNAPKDPNLFYSAETEGKNLTFNFPINLKLGYMF